MHEGCSCTVTRLLSVRVEDSPVRPSHCIVPFSLLPFLMFQMMVSLDFTIEAVALCHPRAWVLPFGLHRSRPGDSGVLFWLASRRQNSGAIWKPITLKSGGRPGSCRLFFAVLFFSFRLVRIETVLSVPAARGYTSSLGEKEERLVASFIRDLVCNFCLYPLLNVYSI